MNILEVKDLCKTYIVNKRQNNVLKNINFTIGEGEMVAVMGPSGSGKSTLLYTVSGMDDPTAGEVRFCGKNIAGMGEKELADLRLDEMGFIFQQMYMLKNLTILDNIILPATQSKSSGNPAGKRCGGVRSSCAGSALSTLPTTTSTRFRAVSFSARASAAV